MAVKTSHHINYKSILLHVKIEHPQKTKLFPEDANFLIVRT